MSFEAPPLEMLFLSGLVWVRPVIRKWERTLRNPTVGTLVEFLYHRDIGCMRVDSREARKLLRRIATG